MSGKLRAEPAQALRVGDGVRGHERDVLEARPGAGDEDELDGHQVFADDPQPRHRRQRVLRRRDPAVDRVLDRDHGGIRSPLDDVRERLADVAHRPPDLPASFGHLRQSSLREGPRGTEIAVGPPVRLGLVTHGNPA